MSLFAQKKATNNDRTAAWNIDLPIERFLSKATDNGWVMVKGNAKGQFSVQIDTQKGVKEEIEHYISRM